MVDHGFYSGSMEAIEEVSLSCDLDLIYVFFKDHWGTDCREIRVKERHAPFLLKYKPKEPLSLLKWNECRVWGGGVLFIYVKVLPSVSKKGIGITGHFVGPQEKRISDSRFGPGRQFIFLDHA